MCGGERAWLRERGGGSSGRGAPEPSAGTLCGGSDPPGAGTCRLPAGPALGGRARRSVTA